MGDDASILPVSAKGQTPQEKKQTMDALTFLVEKRDSHTKSRTCANGSVQQGWMSREESASPTAALANVIITGVIHAHEKHDASTVDAPNAFVQTHVKCKPCNEWATMKMQGVLVNMLVELNPGSHEG